MQTKRSKYELACRFEESGFYMVAFSMFRECLVEKNYDQGVIMFKCGWCLEHSEGADNNMIISYYLGAGKIGSDSVCRMNGFFRAGWLLMQLNKNTEAIEAYSKSIGVGHAEGIYNSIYSEALYWCAVCLEKESRVLDAIELYRTVTIISPHLKPESLYREICCNITIGRYNDAIKLSNEFTQEPPTEFSTARYNELKELVKIEQTTLKVCCN
jgi:tetratricopeptide (TPR) repeat protein